MVTIEYTVQDYYDILCDCLNEYQLQALDDAISAFGFNMKTLDKMLCVWYGMETESFINTIIE